MIKAIVVYESKYGNTKLVAEAIVAGMNRVAETSAVLAEANDVDLTKIDEFDTILIGSPNHMGGPTRGIRKFIDKLRKLNLKNKYGAVFDTYLAKDFEKAVKKMEKQIDERIPGLTLAAPGLSIRVNGMKGPITEGELPKCEEFGARIANKMKE